MKTSFKSVHVCVIIKQNNVISLIVGVYRGLIEATLKDLERGKGGEKCYNCFNLKFIKNNYSLCYSCHYMYFIRLLSKVICIPHL